MLQVFGHQHMLPNYLWGMKTDDEIRDITDVEYEDLSPRKTVDAEVIQQQEPIEQGEPESETFKIPE